MRTASAKRFHVADVTAAVQHEHNRTSIAQPRNSSTHARALSEKGNMAVRWYACLFFSCAGVKLQMQNIQRDHRHHGKKQYGVK